MDNIWNSLHKEAKKIIDTREISPFIEFGNTSCAILTDQNNIYTGLSINSNTDLKTTAEKSAISKMISNGETVVKKMVILNELEEIIMPSINCLDFLLELNPEFGGIEILVSLDKKKTILLKDIIPDWWGTYRNKKN